MCSEKRLMPRTQVKELTIGTKQALVGDKRRQDLIGGCTLWLSSPRQHGAVRQRTESYSTRIQNLFLSISLLWYIIMRPFTYLWMQHWYFLAEGYLGNWFISCTKRFRYHKNCYFCKFCVAQNADWQHMKPGSKSNQNQMQNIFRSPAMILNGFKGNTFEESIWPVRTLHPPQPEQSSGIDFTPF